MRFLKAMMIKRLSCIQKLRHRLLKRKVENARKLIPAIHGYLHQMGYNRGARRRFWKDFIKSIEKLDQF